MKKLAALLAAGFLAAGCLRNPVTDRRQARLISEASEREIGAKTRDELVKEYGELDDAGVRAYVTRVGRRVASVSDRPRLEYVFTVLDSDVVNAFAAPGGFIFVTRGLLRNVNSEAELAVVLGHEVGHVCAWHGVTMIQKEMGTGILTLLGTVAAGVTAGPEASIAVLQTAGLFSDLYLLGYSRENELQADHVGFRYALSAGYDAREALKFFRRLEELEKQSGADDWEPYLKSHPPTADRINLARQFLDSMTSYRRPPLQTAGEFTQQRERLSRPTTEGVGHVEGRKFVQPSYGISVELPPKWTWEVRNQQVLASFIAPSDGAGGELRRKALDAPLPARDFARLLALERRWKPIQGREALYPAGYVYIGSYAGEGSMGGGYLLKVLFVVRGSTGYALVCSCPPDKETDYLLPFEGIMRSFTLK